MLIVRQDFDIELGISCRSTAPAYCTRNEEGLNMYIKVKEIQCDNSTPSIPFNVH